MNKPPLRLPRILTLAALALGTAASPLLADDVITIDGSSTVYPITKLAGEGFEKKSGGKVKVDVNFSGSSAGFRKFVKGELDIADASRPILSKEIEAAKANGVEYIEIPIAYDALTVAVHPDNAWLNSIKTSELKKMWDAAAEGKATKWSDINPEWPEEEFVLYGAGTDSGTYDYFAEVITGSKKLRGDFTGSEDDTVIIEGIAGNKNALGFVPYSYVFEAKDKIKTLGIAHDRHLSEEGKLAQNAPPIKPTNKAVYEGIYNPLGRPLFIYVNVKSLEEKPYLTEFLQYFMKNAPSYINQAHYLPLSEVAYLQALKHVKNRQTGTRFDGTPATGIAHHNMFSLKPKNN